MDKNILFRYEQIIDEDLINIIPSLIANQIGNVIEDYRLNNFNISYDLLPLTEEEILKELDIRRTCEDSGYYFKGQRCTYEEMKLLIKETYKKLVLKFTHGESYGKTDNQK